MVKKSADNLGECANRVLGLLTYVKRLIYIRVVLFNCIHDQTRWLP